MVRTEAGCGVVGEEKLTEKSEEGRWKKGVIRMVRKRWRGVAPYFYTVWPLFCIIPHLARSSRDAGPRYADHHHTENPNLPSVSPFRRMMDDVGVPPGTQPLGSFSLTEEDAFQPERRANHATIFSRRIIATR